jgi:hypothetical protein
LTGYILNDGKHIADRLFREKKMTASPHPQSSSVAALMAERQTELSKNDEQLALELGFDKSSIIAMVKQGAVKLPVQKVSALASALSIDPGHLLRLVLAESMPDVLAAVDALSPSKILTANEIRLVEAYRQLSKGRDVSPLVVDGNSIIALVVA